MKKPLLCLMPILAAATLHAGLAEWQAAVTADNPRNWYQFDETSGTTLLDHGSQALEGEFVEVEINQTGLFGANQAANFPGLPDLDDLVMFAENSADFTVSGDWTAEFILNKASAGLDFSQALFNGPDTSVRLEQWNAVALFGDNRGGVTQYGVADYYLEGTVAPPDEWSHMVFVRTGAQTIIYLNGVNRGSMDAVVDLQMQTISRSNTGSEFDKLHALLDEAVVYDRALSADAVAAHFVTTGITPPSVPPAIATQPQSQSIVIGTPDATAVFSVVASGTLPLEYQWKLNGEDLEGATSDTLSLTEVTSADVGTYSVVVSNLGGSEPSADATLSIDAPPFDEGANQTVLTGFPATFSVTLPEVEGYTFVWKKDDAVIDGETGSSLTIDSTTASDSGSYTLDITFDANTAAVPPSSLLVAPVPTQSYADTVLADDPVSYYRLGESDQAIVMVDEQDRFNGEYFLEVQYELPGALLGDADTAAAFTGVLESKADVFSDDALVTPRFSVEFWAMRTGGAGSFTSPITQRDLNNDADPPYRKGWTFYATDANIWQYRIGDGTDTWQVIDGPPVADGEWVSIVGSYDGTAMALYVNGALVESREAPYAPIDPAELLPLLRVAGGSTEDIDGGFFFIGRIDEVALYDEALTAEQVAAHWAAAYSPDVLPVIDQQPQSTEVVAGGSATLSVQARSGTPMSYQWKKDGADVPGANSDTLVLTDATDEVAGEYLVEITNSEGTTTSDVATIGVVGPEATYVATVTRDEPVAYWRLDETSGTTAADSVGSHDGEYLNGVTLGQPGALIGDDNLAAGFTQADSTKVDVPWSEELNSPEFTFECWAMVTGGSAHRSPMTSRGDGPQEGYIFYADPGDNWQFWTGPGWNNIGGASVENDTWVYLAGTFDGTTKRFYVNGQEVSSTQTAFSPNDTDVLRIGGGATEGDGNYFFEGVVDEAAVYDKALSGARILTHYMASGHWSSEAPLLGIAMEGENVVLSWDGDAVLQEAASLSGAVNWADVAGATSPYSVTPTDAEKYWRLRTP